MLHESKHLVLLGLCGWCLSPISASAILLFGGRVDVQHAASTITVDSWFGLRSTRRTIVLFKRLRQKLDQVLRQKVEVRGC